jgi:hypothetical protein
MNHPGLAKKGLDQAYGARPATPLCILFLQKILKKYIQATKMNPHRLVKLGDARVIRCGDNCLRVKHYAD